MACPMRKKLPTRRRDVGEMLGIVTARVFDGGKYQYENNIGGDMKE